MNWIEKIFTRNSKPEAALSYEPGSRFHLTGLEQISFGRYSDNNKTYSQSQSWKKSEELFREKKFDDAVKSFFEFLADKDAGNVQFQGEQLPYTFSILQGSKCVTGTYDGQYISAEATMAIMDTPVTAAMRRILDMNYNLLYCYCAVKEQNQICMVFGSSIASANPNKLYYGLRELSIKADRQDDQLLADFSVLKPVLPDHITAAAQTELEVKHSFFRQWIGDTVTRADSLNPDSYAAGISYILLGVVYRIDFLIRPEGRLLTDLEKISSNYWGKKDELTLVERNKILRDQIAELKDMDQAEFAKSIYNSKASFAITVPPGTDKYREQVQQANRDSNWYADRKYPDVALNIAEYGMLYTPFMYSVPKVQTELLQVYMAVLFPEYMVSLGMNPGFYNRDKNMFNADGISSAINEIIARNSEKYKQLKADPSKLNYKGLQEFAISFSDLVTTLNLDLKK